MMSLFEVVNDYLGQSYFRVYVWAEHEQQALEMATEAFKNEASLYKGANAYPSDFWEKLRIAKLFSADTPAFVTLASGDGWRTSPIVIHKSISH